MHWFTPHRIDGDLGEAVRSLETVNIFFELTGLDPYYTAKYEGGHAFVMKTIGRIEVLDSGKIRALAYERLSGRELRCILGSAEQAATEPPHGSRGWYRRRNDRRPRWECEVMIEVDGDEDEQAALVVRDATREVLARTAERRISKQVTA